MKSVSIWLVIGVGLLGILNASGQVLMRLGGRDLAARSIAALVTRPVWVSGLLLCWFCGLAWAVLVTRVPLGIGTPLFMGTFFATLGLLTYLWLGEPLTMRQGIGFLLLFSGILLASTK